jgi:hypothetical protein
VAGVGSALAQLADRSQAYQRQKGKRELRSEDQGRKKERHKEYGYVWQVLSSFSSMLESEGARAGGATKPGFFYQFILCGERKMTPVNHTAILVTGGARAARIWSVVHEN